MRWAAPIACFGDANSAALSITRNGRSRLPPPSVACRRAMSSRPGRAARPGAPRPQGPLRGGFGRPPRLASGGRRLFRNVLSSGRPGARPPMAEPKAAVKRRAPAAIGRHAKSRAPYDPTPVLFAWKLLAGARADSARARAGLCLCAAGSRPMLWRWATGERWSAMAPARGNFPELVRAVIAGEDARFCTHRGVDWTSCATRSRTPTSLSTCARFHHRQQTARTSFSGRAPICSARAGSRSPIT